MPRLRVRRFVLLAAFTTLVLWSAGPAAAGCLPASITDNGYIGTGDGNDSTGTDAGMTCCLEDRTNLFPGTVEDVNVSLALEHTFVGDLVVKLKSPTGTVSTVLSQPGCTEANDTGAGCIGRAANWANDLVLFDEQSGGPGTENLGFGLTTSEAVCADDGVCEYVPEQGAGPGSGLDDDFDGETYVGTWELCVADAFGGDTGMWTNYSLQLTVDRSIPCVCANKFRGGDRVRYLGVALAPRAGDLGLNASEGAALGASPPPVGTEGEVMCGQTFSVYTPILTAWDGHTDGHLGNGFCACPTGGLPSPSGYYMECNEIEFVLPFKDDFETGNFIRWSGVQGGGV